MLEYCKCVDMLHDYVLEKPSMPKSSAADINCLNSLKHCTKKYNDQKNTIKNKRNSDVKKIQKLPQ